MAKWPWIAGGLTLAAFAWAAGGKKKEKKALSVEGSPVSKTNGAPSAPVRRRSLQHGGDAQAGWEKAFAAQAPQRQMLISLWPGAGFMINWLRRLYNIPILFKVGYPSARDRAYAKGEIGAKKFFETKEDSAMLQSGLALRIDVGLFQKKTTGVPTMAGTLPSIYVDVTGRWFVWDEISTTYIPVPISPAKDGVVDVRSGVTRESVASQWPAGLAYGDADNVLWALSTWNGTKLQTLPQGPQGNQARVQIASMFPPIRMLDPEQLRAALGGGEAPEPSILEDPAGWIVQKGGEAAADLGKAALEEGAEWLGGFIP